MSDTTKIKVRVYDHPSWDSTLTVHEGPSAEQIAKGYLGHDDDPDLLTSEPDEMTEDELLALPDFNG